MAVSTAAANFIWSFWSSRWSALSAVFLFCFTEVFASNAGVALQMKVRDPQGSLIDASSVNVRVMILSEAQNGVSCVLRDETFPSVNITKGYLAVQVGSGSRGVYDPGKDLKSLFLNSSDFTGLTCLDSSGNQNGLVSTYSPQVDHARRFRVSFSYAGDNISVEFRDKMMTSALVAENAKNSEKFSGKSVSDFVQIPSGQPNYQSRVNDLVSDSGNAIMSQILGGTYAIPSARVTGLGALATMTVTGTPSASTYLRGDGTWATVSAGGGGTVTSVSGAAPISVATGTSTPVISISDATTSAKGAVQVGSGLSVASGVVSLPDTGTAGTYGSNYQVPVITTDAKGRVTGVTVSSITINGSAITAGTIDEARLPSLDASKIGAGTMAKARLPSDIVYNGGTSAVGIGSAAVSSALLSVTSTNSGFLMPRMTASQRDGITSPATGLQVYNTDSNQINYYNGSSWQALGVAGAGISSLIAGTGLTGGTITTSGTIAVDVGTTANKIVQLDGSARLPAVDASQVIGLTSLQIPSLDAAKITTGVFTASQIPSLDWSKITTGKPTTISGYGITNAVTNAGSVISMQSGLDVSKGSATTAGRLYVATDTSKVYFDDGTQWVQVASNTGTTYTAGTGLSLSSGTFSVSTVPVANGGTGATTPAGARTNLGITATGDSLATATSAANARSAISAAGSGANADITSMTQNVDFSSTGAIKVPSGTTAQQPGSPSNGMIRYNADNNAIEARINGAWSNIATTSQIPNNTNFVDLTSNQTVAGNKTLSGNTSVGGTLGVTGATTLSSTLAVTGNVNVNSGKFFVDATGGSVGIGTATPDPTAKMTVFNSTTPYVRITDGTRILNVGTDSSQPTLSGFVTSTDGFRILTNAGTVTAMSLTSSGKVGLGTTNPSASSILEVASTTSGFLMPRMTTTQRDAIATPATGLQVYNTTTNQINYYNGSAWQALGVSGAGVQSITAGTGLTGGTITSTGTVAVDVGTTANKIVQLDGSARLPAVDASLLTGLTASQIPSLDAAKITTGTFTASQIPSLDAAKISTGTIPIARGGTNSGTTLNNNRVMISSSGAIVESPAITASRAIASDANGLPVASTTSATELGYLTGVTSAVQTQLNSKASSSGWTNYSVITSNGSGALTAIPGSSAGQMLNWTVTGPAWTTATFPTSTTANQLLYSSANNVVGGLTTANNAILTTNGSGVPSWTALSGDAFTQYALLAGRSGGQTINGGTAASNNLTLDSTSNATKGNIILNPTGGNVGIGNSSPLYRLDVTGNIANSARFSSSIAGLNYLDLQNTDSTSTSGSVARLITRNVANSGTTSFDVVKYVSGSVALNNNETNSAAFTSFGIGGTERMRINSSGNIGVGTTSPAAMLDVNGSAIIRSGAIVRGNHAAAPASIDAGQIFELSNSSAISGLTFSASDARFLTMGIHTDSAPYVRGTNNGLNFIVGTNIVKINGSGNVGVGTTSPTAALHLKSGTAAASTAPLKFTAGTNLTTPEAGAIEFDGTNLYFTDSTNTRRTLATSASASITGVTAGTGLSGGGTSGTVTLNLSNVGTAGTYAKVTTDAQGRVTAGASLAASDIPNLDAAKISTGTLPIARGGTNSGTTLTNNRVMISSSGAIVENAAITASRAIASDANGLPVASTTSATELGYLTGVTSAVQTQLNAKASSSGWTNYSVITSNGSGALTAVAGSSAGQMLNWTVTGPAWTTATFPTSTTANQLLYSSANNVVGGLATANNAILTTNGSGVPSWTALSGDAFTQYALLAGRSGGQTINGGTAASNNLTLDSTSNVTKGNVILTPGGGSVGVGTNSPVSKFSVAGDITSTANTGSFRTWGLANGSDTSLVLQAGAASGTGGNIELGRDGNIFYDAGIHTFRSLNGATDYLRIDSSGNIGVGTTSPNQIMHLHKSSGSAGVYSQFTNGDTGTTNTDGLFVGLSSLEEGRFWLEEANPILLGTSGVERLRINATGNVGIGTANPATLLQINGASYPTSSVESNGAATIPQVGGYRSRGTISSKTAAQSGDWLYRIGAVGFGATAYPGTWTGEIGFIAEENFTDSAMGTQLRFSTTPAGAVSPSPRLTISGSGNVGIGTTSPAVALDLVGGTTGEVMRIKNTNNGGVAAVVFLDDAGVNQGSLGWGNSGSGASRQSTMYLGTRTSNPIQLMTNNTEKLRIDSTGKVGIGTTTPTAKLQVAGQVRSVNSAGSPQLNTSAAVDWDNGNTQSMNVACTSTSFSNMLDGGTYILAVTETGATTCVFSQSGLTFYYSPANGARTSGSRTVYTFQRIGNDVYVVWTSGFQ